LTPAGKKTAGLPADQPPQGVFFESGKNLASDFAIRASQKNRSEQLQVENKKNHKSN